MKIKSLMKSTVIAGAIVCLPFLINAQDPGDGGIDPDPGVSAPLDLGISALVAAGIGFAAKRRYDSKKKDRQLQNKI